MKTNKNENAYKTIGEIAKELDLIDKNTGSLQMDSSTFPFVPAKSDSVRNVLYVDSTKSVKITNYNIFSCNNESDILAEFFFLISNFFCSR